MVDALVGSESRSRQPDSQRRRSRATRRALLALVLAPVLALASTNSVALAAALKQISSDPYTNPTSNHKTQVEPDSHAFGSTIVSAFQTGRFYNGGASNIGFSTSTDGGTNWSEGFLPSSTVYATPAGPYARASDPSTAYDPKHKVWMISWLGIFPNLTDVDVLVSRSTDGGKTFGAPVIVNNNGDFHDKNWTRCDDRSSSPFFGHCYTEFDDASNLNQFQMSTSTDGGLSWGPATTNKAHTCVIGGQPVVQPSGRVVVPIDDCFETAIFSIISDNGGKTWSDPVLVAQIINDGHPGGIRAPTLPSARIDKSGRVYVVWSDCRFENACNAPVGTNDLVLSTSKDGVAWTLPSRIPTAPVGHASDFLLPGLGVDRTTGGNSAELGLVYYYFPDSTCTSPSTCQLNVGFISSSNGGSTWSAPSQLAGPMTMTWLPLTTQGYMVGDYFSTSVVPGHASPIFMVAAPPSPPPNCSNPSTGAPGQGCDQDTFTSAQSLLGGANATSASTAAGTASRHAARLTAPATAQ